MAKICITETTEQVHKYLGKYLLLHRDISEDEELIALAIRERWGDAKPADILYEAAVNSIAALRLKSLRNKKTNPWVDTTVQSDLFANISVNVPSFMPVDGKPKPYYERSILDGLEWWRSRQDAQGTEAGLYRDAAVECDKNAKEAASEANKLEAMIEQAQSTGHDPRDILYAKA